MCGFAGFLNSSPELTAGELRATVRRMADTLYHRGPDDGGEWIDEKAGYAVGFRRLAIVDLSPEGHQPMVSASGRYIIAFNGEIYNHKAIRKEVESFSDITFRGHSDTEVMLAAIETWGLVEAVQRFAGMFAFALWDRKDRILTLARDRIGEKPLYYGWMGSTFLFGSELKALRRHPHFVGEVNRDSLIPLLHQHYIPAPWSIYRDIYKLLPGTLLSIRPEEKGILPKPVAYWSVREAAERCTRNRRHGSTTGILEQLENVLRRTIAEEMVADVPLGAFLSGGVDSSAIVALMQTQSSRPVKTFTVGFHESDFNEAEYAKDVAQHLGTEHTELYVSPQEALEVIPRLPALYDEPFADSSQIPTFLVAQMARRHVTVSLSGDGGDEAFAGYIWYANAMRMWRQLRCMPPVFRQLSSEALSRPKVATWNKRLQRIPPIAGAAIKNRLTADRIYKLAEVLRQTEHVEKLHSFLISKAWIADEPEVPGAREPLSYLNDTRSWPRLGNVLERLQCFDMLTYLPDDIMVKVDRASMGVSLESRAPFLDHRVLEFLWQVPAQLKIRHGKTKWLLRQVLYKYVPEKLIERPKKGFCVPLASWLRGALRDWGEALLAPVDLKKQGFFNVPLIRQLWTEHLMGQRDWDQHLWNVLMFQSWLREQNR